MGEGLDPCPGPRYCEFSSSWKLLGSSSYLTFWCSSSGPVVSGLLTFNWFFGGKTGGTLGLGFGVRRGPDFLSILSRVWAETGYIQVSMRLLPVHAKRDWGSEGSLDCKKGRILPTVLTPASQVVMTSVVLGVPQGLKSDPPQRHTGFFQLMSKQLQAPPGPPKVPKMMTQYPRKPSMGRIGSTIVSILEVQPDTTTGGPQALG